MAKLAVTLIRSPIGYRPRARATVRAIGLRRINQTVFVVDNESMRGMLAQVPYLVRVSSETPEETAGVTARRTMVVTRKTVDEARPAVPEGDSGGDMAVETKPAKARQPRAK